MNCDGFHSAAERRRAKARADYKPVPQIPREENHLTPPAFRDALVELARSCYGWTPRQRAVQRCLCPPRTGAGHYFGCPQAVAIEAGGGERAQ